MKQSKEVSFKPAYRQSQVVGAQASAPEAPTPMQFDWIHKKNETKNSREKEREGEFSRLYSERARHEALAEGKPCPSAAEVHTHAEPASPTGVRPPAQGVRGELRWGTGGGFRGGGRRTNRRREHLDGKWPRHLRRR